MSVSYRRSFAQLLAHNLPSHQTVHSESLAERVQLSPALAYPRAIQLEDGEGPLKFVRGTAEHVRGKSLHE